MAAPFRLSEKSQMLRLFSGTYKVKQPQARFLSYRYYLVLLPILSVMRIFWFIYNTQSVHKHSNLKSRILLSLELKSFPLDMLFSFPLSVISKSAQYLK